MEAAFAFPVFVQAVLGLGSVVRWNSLEWCQLASAFAVLGNDPKLMSSVRANSHTVGVRILHMLVTNHLISHHAGSTVSLSSPSTLPNVFSVCFLPFLSIRLSYTTFFDCSVASTSFHYCLPRSASLHDVHRRSLSL